MRTWAPRSRGIQLNALVGGGGEHWVGAQPVYRVSSVDQREAIVFGKCVRFLPGCYRGRLVVL
jgi:hypothetical protein